MQMVLVTAGEAGEGVGRSVTGDRTAGLFSVWVWCDSRGGLAGLTAGAVGENCGSNEQQQINSSKSAAAAAVSVS